MKEECKNCKYYEGDCGNHHIDFNRHINYDIPAEYVTNCFQPSEKFINKLKEEKVKQLSDFPLDILEKALEMAKLGDIKALDELEKARENDAD